jgi:hypothetical protein
MPFLDVYIGYLDDLSFDWNGENVPKRQSPFFPHIEPFSSYDSPFHKLRNRIENCELEGKQLDWGAWAAKVDRQYINGFIQECYGRDWHEKSRGLPHLINEMNSLKEFVDGLDPTKTYLLVACEL